MEKTRLVTTMRVDDSLDTIPSSLNNTHDVWTIEIGGKFARVRKGLGDVV